MSVSNFRLSHMHLAPLHSLNIVFTINSILPVLDIEDVVSVVTLPEEPLEGSPITLNELLYGGVTHCVTPAEYHQSVDLRWASVKAIPAAMTRRMAWGRGGHKDKPFTVRPTMFRCSSTAPLLLSSSIEYKSMNRRKAWGPGGLRDTLCTISVITSSRTSTERRSSTILEFPLRWVATFPRQPPVSLHCPRSRCWFQTQLGHVLCFLPDTYQPFSYPGEWSASLGGDLGQHLCLSQGNTVLRLLGCGAHLRSLSGLQSLWPRLRHS